MSRYRNSENLGQLESLQSDWSLLLHVGLRWALIALCLLTAFTAFQNFIKFMVTPPNDPRVLPARAFTTYYLTRVVLSIAILLTAPAAFYRLGSADIDPHFAYTCVMISTGMLVAYFLMDEVMSSLSAGKTLREALWALTPFILAGGLLVILGVFSNVRN